MDSDSTNIDPKYLSHQEFVTAYENNEIDFKIVGFRHDKLLFGSEKTIQKILNYSQYLPLIVIPILAYLFQNWWLLLGLLIYVFAAGFSTSKVPFIQTFLLVCIVYWFVKGFSFYQSITIFYFSALYTHIVIIMDRNLQRNWAKQNVLYLKTLYHKLVVGDNLIITKK